MAGRRRRVGELRATHALKRADFPALDPNAPKRGLSAYMFFANDTRDKVRSDNPNMKFGKFPRWTTVDNANANAPCLLGEVGKVLGERWKALTDAQKAPYEKKAAADKKRYEEEKAAYQAVRFFPTLIHEIIC